MKGIEMKNFEKIKKMTPKQLAEYLSNRAGCCFCIYEFEECNEAVGCIEGIERWLQSEE